LPLNHLKNFVFHYTSQSYTITLIHYSAAFCLHPLSPLIVVKEFSVKLAEYALNGIVNTCSDW
jgi:hypothetical protein